MSERYADVILNISHESVDRPFTYIVPEDLCGKLTPGTAVQVPFGNAKEAKLGYVLALRKEAPTGFQLREILGIAEKKVGVEERLLTLAVWMHEHYGCMLNQALKTVLPVKEAVKARPRKTGATGRSEVKNAALSRELTAEQQAVLSELRRAEAEKAGGSYLLFGVTGSGKTEVYMRCIEDQRRLGKQAILLLPEINLTFQTVRYLEERFGEEVAIIHSKLSKGERYRQFLRAARGEAAVMVGPRSALFAPFPNLGLIIIDEEHDGAYRNDSVPRYDAREVAAKRAELAGAQLILGSATPSVESWQRATQGEYRLLRLTKRAVSGAVPAEATVVDLRDELREGNRSVFSRALSEKILSRLSHGEQVMLFMNRRGYARFLSCRSCGEALRCPHCDVTLTLHEDGSLRCHYCGYRTVKPERCPSCGSPYLAGFGMGTQQLVEQTGRMFPAARILRLDADAVRGKDGGQSILEKFRAGKADILIGTQMIVKGHDFPNVTLVGVMAADTELYANRYTSAERCFQLLTQAAGRAGRANKRGEFVIQTYRPEHYAIQSAAAQDYERFAAAELAYRRAAGYPPVLHMLTIQLAAKDETALTRAAALFADCLKKATALAAEEPQCIGPVNAGVYRVQDYFRKMIYMKHACYDILIQIKTAAEAAFRAQIPGGISLLYEFV
ncbi:replication restart helicase PriA [Stomatobaculum longum]|uniref:replication restart helicase PriA n=1 Tax=Stomatobaculum longum TaxID=796942 RepID=UPI0028E5F189|nr:primosomal protein N' [Stomatobaculum longum]